MLPETRKNFRRSQICENKGCWTIFLRKGQVRDNSTYEFFKIWPSNESLSPAANSRHEALVEAAVDDEVHDAVEDEEEVVHRQHAQEPHGRTVTFYRLSGR